MFEKIGAFLIRARLARGSIDAETAQLIAGRSARAAEAIETGESEVRVAA